MKKIINIKYGVIPMHILTNDELSLGAKWCYLLLQSLDDGSQTDLESLSLLTNDDPSTIQQYMDELEQQWYLLKRRTSLTLIE